MVSEGSGRKGHRKEGGRITEPVQGEVRSIGLQVPWHTCVSDGVGSFGKLEGLVLGPWGDCSKDLHNMVKIMEENKVAVETRATGREASDNELGVIVS